MNYETKTNKGFTLLELLIYIAILSSLLITIAGLFSMISTNSSKEESRIEVQQNLQFATGQIADELHSFDDIIINTPNPSGNTDNVLNFQSATTVVEFKISPSGVLQKTRGTTTATCLNDGKCKVDCGPVDSDCTVENITSDKVIVTSPTGVEKIFTRLGETIQIKLEISYNNNGRPAYEFSKKSQTTVSLKK